MVKLVDLKIEGLKKELYLRGAKTSGNKVELQARLRSILEGLGFNPDEFEFEVQAEESSSASNLESPISNNAPKVVEGISENSLREYMSAFTGEVRSMMDSFMRANQDASNRMALGLETFKTDITGQVNQINTRALNLENQISEIKSGVRSEINFLKSRIEELQALPSSSSASLQVAAKKLCPPSFDGTTSFATFKLQFETIASQNMWNNSEKTVALILALKGSAADVLQTVGENDRTSYDGVMETLKRRFGSEHLRQMRYLELKTRKQKQGESLQTYATDVERLVQEVYSRFPT